MEEFSDAGSIPASSTGRELSESESKTKLELSRSRVCALNEHERSEV